MNRRSRPRSRPPQGNQVRSTMATMARSSASRASACAVLFVVAACVSDHTVEDDVVPKPGAVQPEGGASPNVRAATACEKIKNARSAAATKLGCDAPKDECPALLFLAGSTPCDEYVGGSIDACAAKISSYVTCTDFDTKPCVVTPIAASCHAPAAPEAAPPHDGGAISPHDGASKPTDARLGD